MLTSASISQETITCRNFGSLETPEVILTSPACASKYVHAFASCPAIVVAILELYLKSCGLLAETSMLCVEERKINESEVCRLQVC